MKNIKVIVERTNTGYSAYAEKYPVGTTGSNLAEIRTNMTEALNLYFEEQNKTVNEDSLKLIFDLPQFFEFYKEINAKGLSKRIGMNQSLLAQYISGHKKPSVTQTTRILKGVQKLGKELTEVGFLI